jgi:hypothetical protein
MQKDDAMEQCPPLQSCEQHSDDALHALPDVLQDALSALQLPPEQLPPQHWALVVHAWPSEVQAPVEHVPLTHASEQHSVALVHVAPVASQFTGAPPRQVELRGSHCPEQQSESPEHWAAASAQWAWPPSTEMPFDDEPPQLAWMEATTTSVANAAQMFPSTRWLIVPTIRKCGTSASGAGNTRYSAFAHTRGDRATYRTWSLR